MSERDGENIPIEVCIVKKKVFIRKVGDLRWKTFENDKALRLNLWETISLFLKRMVRRMIGIIGFKVSRILKKRIDREIDRRENKWWDERWCCSEELEFDYISSNAKIIYKIDDDVIVNMNMISKESVNCSWGSYRDKFQKRIYLIGKKKRDDLIFESRYDYTRANPIDGWRIKKSTNWRDIGLFRYWTYIRAKGDLEKLESEANGGKNEDVLISLFLKLQDTIFKTGAEIFGIYRIDYNRRDNHVINFPEVSLVAEDIFDLFKIGWVDTREDDARREDVRNIVFKYNLEEVVDLGEITKKREILKLSKLVKNEYYREKDRLFGEVGGNENFLKKRKVVNRAIASGRMSVLKNIVFKEEEERINRIEEDVFRNFFEDQFIQTKSEYDKRRFMEEYREERRFGVSFVDEFLRIFSREEIYEGIKRGKKKGTAAGCDGITYELYYLIDGISVELLFWIYKMIKDGVIKDIGELKVFNAIFLDKGKENDLDENNWRMIGIGCIFLRLFDCLNVDRLMGNGDFVSRIFRNMQRGGIRNVPGCQEILNLLRIVIKEWEKNGGDLVIFCMDMSNYFYNLEREIVKGCFELYSREQGDCFEEFWRIFTFPSNNIIYRMFVRRGVKLDVVARNTFPQGLYSACLAGMIRLMPLAGKIERDRRIERRNVYGINIMKSQLMIDDYTLISKGRNSIGAIVENFERDHLLGNLPRDGRKCSLIHVEKLNDVIRYHNYEIEIVGISGNVTNVTVLINGDMKFKLLGVKMCIPLKMNDIFAEQYDMVLARLCSASKFVLSGKNNKKLVQVCVNSMPIYRIPFMEVSMKKIGLYEIVRKRELKFMLGFGDTTPEFFYGASKNRGGFGIISIRNEIQIQSIGFVGMMGKKGSVLTLRIMNKLLEENMGISNERITLSEGLFLRLYKIVRSTRYDFKKNIYERIGFTLRFVNWRIGKIIGVEQNRRDSVKMGELRIVKVKNGSWVSVNNINKELRSLFREKFENRCKRIRNDMVNVWWEVSAKLWGDRILREVIVVDSPFIVRIRSKSLYTKIKENRGNPYCRICNDMLCVEDMGHLFGNCDNLRLLYQIRHNDVVRIIVYGIKKEYEEKMYRVKVVERLVEEEFNFYKNRKVLLIAKEKKFPVWMRKNLMRIRQTKVDIVVLDCYEIKVKMLEIGVATMENIANYERIKINSYVELRNDIKEEWKDYGYFPVVICADGRVGEICKNLKMIIRSGGRLKMILEMCAERVLYNSWYIWRKRRKEAVSGEFQNIEWVDLYLFNE